MSSLRPIAGKGRVDVYRGVSKLKMGVTPIASWMRDQTLFIFTPVLVCKFPMKTVGVDDAISTTGLLYSQFYRFDSNMKW
ncbi:hypothetical protein Aduo_003827 [Ancylostoma duodenale]